MSLTKEQRAALPDDDFAAPARRALPIHDAHHVRAAWSQVIRANGLNDDERADARYRIVKAAERLGVDLSGTVASMKLDTPLSAMALAMPEMDDHPNRLPFSGVLTRLDEASDKAPHGSKGRKVIMQAEAAEKALGYLLGMGVNYITTQDGHNVKAKVGVITRAEIRDNAVHIDGHLFASDFPEETRRIQSDKDLLGFSWELANIFVESLDADPLVITDCAFTGAAILRKDKAAYGSTSLSAAAEEIDMTKEELAALLGPALKEIIGDRLDKIEASQAKTEQTMQASAEVRAKVEPFASKMDEMADQMEGEGIGAERRSGHAKVLRDMSASMRAEAAQGRVPSSYYANMHGAAATEEPKPDAVNPALKVVQDELAETKRLMADLQASAQDRSPQPERKTLPPAITALLAKADLTMPEGDEKLSGAKVDDALRASGLDISQRARVKASLAQAGKLDR